jgi:hypothetical protein
MKVILGCMEPPWRRSPSWTASCALPGYLNHWHRYASHERIDHMAVPEDVGRDLPPRELLPGRDLLDPGLFRQSPMVLSMVLVLRWPELWRGKSHSRPGQQSSLSDRQLQISITII